MVWRRDCWCCYSNYERYSPGWKKQLTHLVLTYWLEKDSSILNKQEKEIYKTNEKIFKKVKIAINYAEINK